MAKQQFLIITGIALVMPLIFSALATASSTSQPSLTPEQLEILAQGDPAKSADVAKKCARCHGKDGVSDDAEVPHLAGQNPRYVFKQLWDYKQGHRDGGRIKRVAKRLTAQDIANLTARFSSTDLPTMGDVEKPQPPEIVVNGDAGRGVDACNDCHQSTDSPNDRDLELPSLAGMPHGYFVETMLSFKDGVRYNDPDGVMGTIASGLSENEIERLADYYLAAGQRSKIVDEN